MKIMHTALVALTASACAPWPPQSAALDERAAGLVGPALLPADQLQAPLGGDQAEEAGAALAARAAALRL